MDITDIELIKAIVKSGSLLQASALQHQSQPTLSRKLSRLEDQLKAQLFHRSSKGLVPTDIAKYILAKSAPLDHQLREIERHVELVSNLEIGVLNLGVGPIIEQILLPEVLHQFIETTGDVGLSIVTEDDATLLEMFEASDLDLIVGPFRAPDWRSKDIVAVPMIKDDVVAVARHDHPLFGLKSIDYEALREFPRAVPKMQGSARQARGGPDLQRPKIRSDNYNLLIQVTRESDAICAAPRSVFKAEMEQGRLREVPVDLRITWESALIIRSETMLAPLARHLVSLFEDSAAGFQS